MLKVRTVAKTAIRITPVRSKFTLCLPVVWKKSMSETSMCVCESVCGAGVSKEVQVRDLLKEKKCSQLWQVDPEYPDPEQSQENELQVWEQRPPCSHRLGRHLRRRHSRVHASERLWEVTTYSEERNSKEMCLIRRRNKFTSNLICRANPAKHANVHCTLQTG